MLLMSPGKSPGKSRASHRASRQEVKITENENELLVIKHFEQLFCSYEPDPEFRTKCPIKSDE